MVGLTFIIYFTQPFVRCNNVKGVQIVYLTCRVQILTGSSLFHSPRINSPSKGMNSYSSTYRLNSRVDCAPLLWVAAPQHGGKLWIQSPGDNMRKRLFILETPTTLNTRFKTNLKRDGVYQAPLQLQYAPSPTAAVYGDGLMVYVIGTNMNDNCIHIQL